MNFSERLTEYRDSLKLNKREMANNLGFTEGYYNIIENDKRKPSKKFLISLSAFSGKPEEYWLYGIDNRKYKETRDISKSTKLVLEQIGELKLLDSIDSLFKDYEPKNNAELLLIAALKSDLSYIIENNNKGE